MDTDVLRYVLEIEACKNITMAAKRLFISQPALTKQLSRLEKELGYTLFDRAHSPIEPTLQGEIFLDFARRYQALEDEMNREIEASRQASSAPVRIAMTHRGGFWVGRCTAQLLKQHPDLSLEYLNMSSRGVEESLDKELVELAVYTDPVLTATIEYVPIETDPLIFVIPEDSPILAGLDTNVNSLENPVQIPARAFRDPSVRYILATPGQGLYYAENAFLQKYHIRANNPLRVDYVETRYQVACSGCGIAMFPHATSKTQPKNDDRRMIYGIPEGDGLQRHVVAARKRGRRLEPEAELVWQFMTEHSPEA